MNHMKLGNFLDNSDWLNLRTVSYLVSRDKETIKAVWFKHGFKMSHRGKYLMISEDDLLSWMKDHKQYWDATECDYYFFSRLDWFQEKLKADSEIKRYKRWNIEKEA